MIAYFDASAFLKLAIDEDGSDAAHEAWLGAHRRISSRLLYPEARAGLARAHRMRRLGNREFATARGTVEEYIDDVDLVDVTERVTRHAGDLAERYGLRAYDAVHLATADGVANASTVLVSTDAELVQAARSHGIATVAL